MKKDPHTDLAELVLTGDNAQNIRMVVRRCKNVLICGVEGVGKITNTTAAFRGDPNVYYLGNPVDYEGKLRPGSYEKYLHYIHSLKQDIKIIEDVSGLLQLSANIVLIIDEIFGRSSEELDQIDKLLDMENIKVIQIVGCMKYMGRLIRKIDAIIELHPNGAFLLDKKLARSICDIFNRQL